MSEKREIKGVMFYDHWKIPMELLDAERFGKLVKSFLKWAWLGEEPADLDETQIMFFNIAKKISKQDFEKYDAIVEKRREAGRIGSLKRVENFKQEQANQANASNFKQIKQEQANQANASNFKQIKQMQANQANASNFKQIKQMQANQANNNNNNSNNNNYNNNIEKENTADKSATQKTLEERQKDFYNELIPFVDKYGKDMIRSFYNYWSQVNKGGRKMLWEMQKAFEISKRLATWHGKEYNTAGKNEDELYRNSEERMEQAKKEGWI